MIAADIGQETARVDRATTATRDNERQVLALVLVAILEAGAPHHDAVVEQGAVTFADAVHPFDHIGKLLDIEGSDCGDFPHLLRIVGVMSLGMMGVLESQLRI